MAKKTNEASEQARVNIEIRTEKITISDIEIKVHKKNIKNMHLSVLPPMGNVRISVPNHTDDEVIRLFAITKMGWIKKQIKKFENQSRQTEREYISGESHYLWGRRYLMEVKNRQRNSVEIIGNKLILNVRESNTVCQREKVLTEWYRGELKQKLPGLVKKWENIVGIKTSFAGVKDMRTRWGTCNVKHKRIWVNLQLAKKPIECLEYIVVHELVHLLEKNHNSTFEKHLDNFLPSWRITKDTLNSFIR